MLKINTWIRLLFAIPAAMLVQWAFTQLGGMFAGLAINESGTPVSLANYLPARAIASSLAFVFVSVLFTAYFDRQPLSVIGFKFPNKQKLLLAGMLTGLFIIAAVSLLLTTTGHLHFSQSTPDFGMLLMWGVIMLVVGIGEECFFRGYIQRNLQQSLKPWPALFASGFLFMLLHAGNPAQNLLALPGIFTGGMLLGINYLYTGNLWFGIALHTCWNFLQGPVLGYEVSGIKMPSVLQQNVTGPEWLTGGSFGAEASMITCSLNILLTLWLAYHFGKGALHRKIPGHY